MRFSTTLAIHIHGDLIGSMPTTDTEGEQELVAIPGTPPDLLNPPKGRCVCNS